MKDVDDEITIMLTKDLEKGFWHLVRRYQHRLYAFALRLTRNCQDAEDTVQDALLGAYLALSHYPCERLHALHLRPWLYKIVLNVFRNDKRRQHIQWQSMDAMIEDTVSDYFEWEVAEEEQPEHLVELLERRQELEAVIMELPIYYRIIITCYYFEDLTYQEIAELTEQPLGTIKSRLHRGLRQIRQLMQAIPQEKRESYGIQ